MSIGFFDLSNEMRHQVSRAARALTAKGLCSDYSYALAIANLTIKGNISVDAAITHLYL